MFQFFDHCKQYHKPAAEENNKIGKEYYNDLNPVLRNFLEAFNKYLKILNGYISQFGKDIKFGLFKSDNKRQDN